MSSLNKKITYPSSFTFASAAIMERKKKNQLFIRKEKSKSNIQTIMNEIYQEEGKSSKVVKYLTHSNFFRSPDFKIPNFKSKRTIPQKWNSLSLSESNEKITYSHLKYPKKIINTTSSIDFKESPKISTKKYDLEIEDPKILNIYQNSLEKSFQNSGKASIFVTNGEFDEELRRKKIQLSKYVIANTDVVAKIQQKQDKNDKINIFSSADRKKKHINIKEDTIKKRFIKLWNNKNLKKLEKINRELDNKIKIHQDNEIINNSFLNKSARFQLTKIKKHFKKPSDEIKAILKESINENYKRPIKKTNTVEKIKEKYTFSGFINKRIDQNFMESCKKFEKLPKASSKIDSMYDNLINDFVQEKSKDSIDFRSNNIGSPKKKFGIFYNDLIDYHKIEIRDQGIVEKNITNQIKIYDKELKNINEKLFDFNANLDKDFGKEIVEGVVVKFSRIQRHKSKK